MEAHSVLEKIQEYEIIPKKDGIKKSEIPTIKGSHEVCEMFKAVELFNTFLEFKEMFYAMYLSKANKIISIQKISEGTTFSTPAEPRDIIRNAILLNASGIIICHNHPSGNLKASESDKHLTKLLKDCCKMMGISLLDHLIITEEGYLSFADEMML